MKKTISVLLALLLAASLMTPITALAANPPVVDVSSLKVEISDGKTTACKGDTVTVFFKVTAQTTLNNLYAVYLYPSGDNTLEPDSVSYDSATNTASLTFVIQKNTPLGLWKLYGIGVDDTEGNEVCYFNSDATSETPSADLSAGNFTVVIPSGDSGNNDTEAPKIYTSSISLDKTSGSAGDKIKFSVKVSDSSETDVSVNYKNPSGLVTVYNTAYNSQSGKYECSIPITDSMQAGKWKIERISAVDEAGNKALATTNLSAGTFTVICSIKGVYVGKINNVKYTGKAIKPEPFISDGSNVLIKNKDYTLSYKNNVKKGKATIVIKGINGYKGTKKVYFNIVQAPKKPKASKIKKLITGKKKFTVKWKKINGVSGYQIQYSLKKDFKKSSKKTFKKSKTKAVIKGLKKGKKYYVRIRTYKTANGVRVYSKWSAKKTVKIK